MEYKKSDFVSFPVDAGRVVANLEAAYSQWVEATRQIDALPVSLYWQSKLGKDYLAIKLTSADSGTTAGPRSPETEKQLEEFKTKKNDLKSRVSLTNQLLTERAQQYRSLRLPALPDRQGDRKSVV